MAEVISDNGIEILLAKNDEHGGVIVEMEDPIDCKLFHSMLKASMSKWTHEGKKGVWLKLPIKLANLIEAAVEEGFWYHHAEPNYLMLVQWIPKINSTIPANASHRVGIGAIVITEDKKLFKKVQVFFVEPGFGKSLLESRRRYFIISSEMNYSFTINPLKIVRKHGEDICTAAVREVKEETGVCYLSLFKFLSNIAYYYTSVSWTDLSWICFQIDTEFIEILGFRQSHKSFFEKSDLFFVCFLRPLSFDIQRQELEIDAAQWMPIEEYEAQPIVEIHGPYKLIARLCDAKLKNKYSGFKPLPTTSSMSAKTSSFYVNTIDLDLSGSFDQP
ncbi:hypothetical protein V2J09_015193 [Rumex salicifolius]